MNWDDFKKHPNATFCVIVFSISTLFTGVLLIIGTLIGGMDFLASNEQMIAKNRFFISILFVWCTYEFLIKRKS